MHKKTAHNYFTELGCNRVKARVWMGYGTYVKKHACPPEKESEDAQITKEVMGERSPSWNSRET